MVLETSAFCTGKTITYDTEGDKLIAPVLEHHFHAILLVKDVS